MPKQETVTAAAKSELSPEAAVVVGSAMIAEVVPKMALASAQPAQIDLATLVRAEEQADTANGGKLDLASAEGSCICPDMAETKSARADGSPEAATDADAQLQSHGQSPSARVNRFTLLAACLALAAALGGMIGALAAFTMTRPQAVAVLGEGKLTPEEVQALKENIVQARVELAALRASLDAANRGSATQLTKIGERVERMERNAGEPTAKLAKAAETLERLARSELTGSIVPPQPTAGAAGKLDGWVLRDVHRGVALLEGRSGVIEVEQGDLIPGLGRVDAIRKQDGRWTVVTSKGVITAR